VKNFLFILLFFSAYLSSCQDSSVVESAEKKWIDEKDKLRVLCTTEMVASLVSSVADDKIALLVLIKGELDPHSYEPVKGDEEKLFYADLVFYNGLGLEHGPSLRNYLQGQEKAVAISKDLLEVHSQRLIEIDGAVDPHIWMDISLFSEGIKVIERVLKEKDPLHKEIYQKNAVLAYREFQEKHQSILELVWQLPENKRYLVTSHDAFNYFAYAYLATEEEKKNGSWKQRVMAPEGLAPEGHLSLHDIKNVVEHLRRYKIPCLFPEANVNKDAINKVLSASLEKGMEVSISRFALYGDSMGEEGKERGSYFRMLEHNAQSFVQEMSKPSKEEIE
jgi:manganese/zinc/iron transport system substrate-binding protein